MDVIHIKELMVKNLEETKKFLEEMTVENVEEELKE